MKLVPVQLVSLAFAALSCAAQTALPRYPVTQQAVADALTTAGVPTGAPGIALPSAVTSTVPSPKLALESLGLAGPSQLRMRVTCTLPGQCLPFLVVATYPEHTAALSAQQQLMAHTASVTSPRSGNADLLRAGTHATLLLEDDRMRISVPVISIDTGAPGNDVRVASLDRKQTWHGVVTSPSTVRGVLP